MRKRSFVAVAFAALLAVGLFGLAGCTGSGTYQPELKSAEVAPPVIGEEGNGKSTLLHLIRNTLEKRSDLRIFYMPQDAGDLLDFSLSPVELLSPSGKKEE